MKKWRKMMISIAGNDKELNDFLLNLVDLKEGSIGVWMKDKGYSESALNKLLDYAFEKLETADYFLNHAHYNTSGELSLEEQTLLEDLKKLLERVIQYQKDSSDTLPDAARGLTFKPNGRQSENKATVERKNILAEWIKSNPDKYYKHKPISHRITTIKMHILKGVDEQKIRRALKSLIKEKRIEK